VSPGGDIYEKTGAGTWTLRASIPAGPQGPAGPAGPTGAALTGIVAGNGTIIAGTGFTITRTAVGTYTVTFTTPFAAAPVMLGQDVAATRVCCWASVTASSAQFLIVNTAGTAVDDAWNFAAIRVT
jgi:hypothetical protein